MPGQSLRSQIVTKKSHEKLELLNLENCENEMTNIFLLRSRDWRIIFWLAVISKQQNQRNFNFLSNLNQARNKSWISISDYSRWRHQFIIGACFCRQGLAFFLARHVPDLDLFGKTLDAMDSGFAPMTLTIVNPKSWFQFFTTIIDNRVPDRSDSSNLRRLVRNSRLAITINW